MMNLQEFIDNHYEDGEVYSEVDGVEFKRVFFEEEAEHKTVTVTEVFQLILNDVPTDEYFEVATVRDNCGYWGYGERYDPTFRKVKPVEKTITVYVGA
jgi:hypothetical protein